jgi:hypothetical protein
MLDAAAGRVQSRPLHITTSMQTQPRTGVLSCAGAAERRQHASTHQLQLGLEGCLRRLPRRKLLGTLLPRLGRRGCRLGLRQQQGSLQHLTG